MAPRITWPLWLDTSAKIITTDMFASFPAALEMLFLFAFSIGRHSAAACTHLLFLFATAAAFLGFGFRFKIAKAGIAATVLFCLSPIVGIDASVAYVDVAEACVCFALFYTLELWRHGEDDRVLALAGIMAGFAASVKYPGFMAIPFTLGVVIWRLRTDFGRLRRCSRLLLFPALLLVAPWLIKNIIEVQNPISPFANRLFRNPYVHISFEEGLRRQLAHPNGVTWPQVPVEAAVLGERLGGILGPTFLLAPLALFAARTPMGRRILLAGVTFGFLYPGNLGTRFLIPALPFISLAMSMALSYWRWSAVVVLLFHFVVCQPIVIEKYAAPYLWHLEGMRWDETLRRRPETETLAARSEDYGMARYIDRNLPGNARVFEVGDLPRAYARQVIDSYYGNATNEKLYYAIYCGVFQKWEPSYRRTFRFPATHLRSLRVRQTGAPSEEVWAISELRLFHKEREVIAEPRWRFQAHPFPWDITLAFDHNPVTMWRAWESARPDMFVEVLFDRPLEVDEVSMEGPREQKSMRFAVVGEDDAGREPTLSSAPTSEEFSLPAGWRRWIGRELRSNGYTHFVIRRGIPGYEEIRRNPEEWGMQLSATCQPYILYSLE
jgi:hypothetical protein